jgi:coenzyme F420-0:L-glutamate ligase/coenzyme F420-1:gamma-L-glutamate ligase
LSARRLLASLQKRLRRTLGVVIVDSRVTPLRLGTIGLALATAGFRQVRDFRGVRDLYGRRTQITFQALADDLAGAAHLLMGEARESVPFVLVRGAPVDFGAPSMRSVKLRVKECLYMSQIARSL